MDKSPTRLRVLWDFISALVTGVLVGLLVCTLFFALWVMLNYMGQYGGIR